MVIDAVVVTYNRKELLVECLDAIKNQSFDINRIFLIDNNSTDGTYEHLKEKNVLCDKIKYIKLEKNIGGAGGFYEGMKEARKDNPDWIWIMDDDTIPTNDCLKSLVEAKDIINEKISFLASTVYGINGEPMNVPKINDKPEKNGYAFWYKYLSKGIVKINEATFVSLLINGQAVKEVGLPVKDYFIWGDDTEYTLRLNKYFGNAYFVGNSQVIHKRKISGSLSLINEENRNRINMYFYMVRNNYINTKTYRGKRKLIKYILLKYVQVLKIIFSKCKHKFLKAKVILKGLLYAQMNKYDYDAFKNRLNS